MAHSSAGLTMENAAMRRLTLAALSAALVLSACSEQSRDNPTEPRSVTPPSAVVAAVSCVTPFPNLTSQFTAVFAAPTSSALIKSAQDKLAAIKSQCGKGKVADAQAKALYFVDWTLKKYGARQIPSATPVELATFFSSLFVAVGLQFGSIDPAIFGPHGGAGVYTPGLDFLLKNGDGNAAIHLDGTPSAFAEPTLITILRLPDSDQLVTNGEQQFPPFYDYNAANASGNHTVNGFAIIGFCVNDHDLGNPQIGHNPLGGGFEVLEPASATEYANLGLICPTQDNLQLTLNFGDGLQGLALSAWHTAGHYAGPVAEAMFLPQPLHATTLNPGGLGSRGSTISPFGEVDATYTNTVESIGFDPTGGTFVVGEPIGDCSEGCSFPEFQISGGTVSGTINATLIPLNGSTGTLSGTTSVPTSGEGNTAVFSNLRVSAPGTYLLIFAAPDAEPYRTGSFTVEEAGPIL
jgi:hypothetical protein